MTTIKAVIGANYGDEGKGKMTDYFVYQLSGKSLVVCTNGGSQRGHTVVVTNLHHIFHHFGSGAMAGADTYLPKQFIVNPITFMQEIYTLENFYAYHFVYINENCLCSTPFDMILNQLIEEQREHKHGSCGIGIWETILRNGLTIGELSSMTDDNIRKYLIAVRDGYTLPRLVKKNMSVTKYWIDIFYSKELIEHYIKDLRAMLEHCILINDSIFNNYHSIIFENGQGLLLDQNIKDSQYSTPSNTGSKDIRAMVNQIRGKKDIEICYVTRSYLTRHGEGELLNECSISDINPILLTETNHWNKNQGIFRYGKLDIDNLIQRTESDFKTYWKDTDAHMSYAITHLDERNVDYSKIKCTVYESFGTQRHTVTVSNNHMIGG